MALFETDVLIVGGGAAGVAASVAAAQEGVSTTLFERNSYLGGRATASAVGTVCGLYFRSNDSIPNYVTSGFAKEFGEKLKEVSKSNPRKNRDGLFYLPYAPLQFQLLCDKYLQENNVNLLANHSLNSLEIEDSKIKKVTASSFGNTIEFVCKTIIDCTGETTLSATAKLDLLPITKQQAAAHVFEMEGIKENDEHRLALNIIRAVMKGLNEGKISKEAERLTIVPGSLKDGRVFLKLGLLPDSFKNQSDLHTFSTDLINKISDFLINYLKAFNHSKLVSIAPEIGFRSGRRPLGKYVLTEHDVLKARKFDDSIANGSWPIEFWNEDKKPIMKYFEMQDYYQIPSRCLISNQATNLYFAGKNISATDFAIASARVMGTCLQTGWAAGKLAAFKVLGKEEKEAIKKISENLIIS